MLYDRDRDIINGANYPIKAAHDLMKGLVCK